MRWQYKTITNYNQKTQPGWIIFSNYQQEHHLSTGLTPSEDKGRKITWVSPFLTIDLPWLQIHNIPWNAHDICSSHLCVTGLLEWAWTKPAFKSSLKDITLWTLIKCNLTAQFNIPRTTRMCVICLYSKITHLFPLRGVTPPAHQPHSPGCFLNLLFTAKEFLILKAWCQYNQRG